MKILAVSTWFPYPPDNGARNRVHHLLGHLARRHTVDLVTLYQHASDLDHLEMVGRTYRRVAAFPEPIFEPNDMSRWHDFLSPIPRYFVAHHSEEMAERIDRWVSEETYDAVFAVTLGAAPYACRLPIALRVLDEHNVESQVTRRMWSHQRSLAGRLRYWPTCVKAERFERAMASHFNLVAVVSETEAEHMTRLLGPARGAAVEVIANGCDPKLLIYDSPGRRGSDIVFTGALTYEPNHEAARRLCTGILPLVQARVPGARLRITGRHDGFDVSEFTGAKGVELTGYVNDIRPLVASASALIVPLRHGGGTRLKVIEAMALGTPVVSTRMGAEGIAAEDGVHILYGETDEELAEQTIRLMKDPALTASISCAARELISERYQWSAIADKLDRSMTRALVEGRKAHAAKQY